METNDGSGIIDETRVFQQLAEATNESLEDVYKIPEQEREELMSVLGIRCRKESLSKQNEMVLLFSEPGTFIDKKREFTDDTKIETNPLSITSILGSVNKQSSLIQRLHDQLRSAGDDIMDRRTTDCSSTLVATSQTFSELALTMNWRNVSVRAEEKMNSLIEQMKVVSDLKSKGLVNWPNESLNQHWIPLVGKKGLNSDKRQPEVGLNTFTEDHQSIKQSTLEDSWEEMSESDSSDDFSNTEKKIGNKKKEESGKVFNDKKRKLIKSEEEQNKDKIKGLGRPKKVTSDTNQPDLFDILKHDRRFPKLSPEQALKDNDVYSFSEEQSNVAYSPFSAMSQRSLRPLRSRITARLEFGTCPICGDKVEMSRIQAHANSCQ